MTTLTKRGKLRLHYQLKSIIDDWIASGEWAPGAQVLSERELCEEFIISRITVRQALSQLVVEGQLVREHGRGTFVAQPSNSTESDLADGFHTGYAGAGHAARGACAASTNCYSSTAGRGDTAAGGHTDHHPGSTTKAGQRGTNGGGDGFFARASMSWPDKRGH